MADQSQGSAIAAPIEQTPGEPEPIGTPFSTKLLEFPLTMEVIFLVLGAMATDGGGLAKIALGTLISHCLGIALIVSRRRNRLTKGDLLYIKLGWALFWFISPFFLSFWMDYALRHHWSWLLE